MPVTKSLKRKLEFNVAGPCIPGDHYMLDPLRGIGGELMELIDGNKYFVIHAARQTGKTTLLLDLVDKVNAGGDYHAIYCSLETASWVDDPKDGIPTIVNNIGLALSDYGMPDGFTAAGAAANDAGFATMLMGSLKAYCKTLDKPLVIFFDEADCLSEGTLISFLRQLRNGYNMRKQAPFVYSVALVGMRNIRDYRARVRPESESLGGASPFNVIRESFNLRNLTKAEIIELYAQHTDVTGQAFEPEMIDYIFEQTQGQPWLVNAIACECVEKIIGNNFSIPVTQGHAEQAIQNIVRDRKTHIDSMLDKLKEPRVRNILVPYILGEAVADKGSEDYLFTKDLGLIRENEDGGIEPANPIYAALITRTLNWSVQESIKDDYKDYIFPRYLKDGKVDMDFLLRDFQQFWRENCKIMKNRYKKDLFEYDEAATHLVLMAFLQRVINGNGIVTREKAKGTKRVDLCVTYKDQKYPVELKILQNERGRENSLAQTLEYMDGLGADTGWLVIFDKRADEAISWDEKIYMKEETLGGKRIVVVGC